MKYHELLDLIATRSEREYDLRAQALYRMMDAVEIETGEWPKWSDEAPDWIVNQFINLIKEKGWKRA